MQTQATAKYIRTSTRKLRLVADAIRPLTAAKALQMLRAMDKAAADPMIKLIGSAVANAKQQGLDATEWKFAKIEVMGGPSMKRFHAVSRGMAHAYKKRMTHVTVVLTDGVSKEK